MRSSVASSPVCLTQKNELNSSPFNNPDYTVDTASSVWASQDIDRCATDSIHHVAQTRAKDYTFSPTKFSPQNIQWRLLMSINAIPVTRGCSPRKSGGVYFETGISDKGQPVEYFLCDPPVPVDDWHLSPVGVQLIERNGITVVRQERVG